MEKYTGYCLADISLARRTYMDTRGFREYFAKIKEGHPDANERDYALLWQGFDLIFNAGMGIKD